MMLVLISPSSSQSPKGVELHLECKYFTAPVLSDQYAMSYWNQTGYCAMVGFGMIDMYNLKCEP